MEKVIVSVGSSVWPSTLRVIRRMRRITHTAMCITKQNDNKKINKKSCASHRCTRQIQSKLLHFNQNDRERNNKCIYCLSEIQLERVRGIKYPGGWGYFMGRRQPVATVRLLILMAITFSWWRTYISSFSFRINLENIIHVFLEAIFRLFFWNEHFDQVLRFYFFIDLRFLPWRRQASLVRPDGQPKALRGSGMRL